MLNKKIFSISGAGVTLTALLLVFTVGMPTDIQKETPITYNKIPSEILENLSEQPNDYPLMYGGGFPPPMPLDRSVGNEIAETSASVQGFDSPESKSANPEHVKYKSLKKVVAEYKKLQVYVDESTGEKDIFLSKKRIASDTTDADVLYSQEHIWITINPYEQDPELIGDYYTNYPLNDGYELISVNEQVTNSPLRVMTQIVNFDGTYGMVLPLDLWFVTDDLSYTIRGHITQDEAIELANAILTIEE